MSIDSYQRAVQNHHQAIARLQHEKSRQGARAADKTKQANLLGESARRANSPATMQSRIRDAQRYQDEAVRCQKQVADIESKIAQEHRRLIDAQNRLAKAQEQESRKQLQEQQRVVRNQDRTMKVMAGKLTDHDQLHAEAFTAIEKLQQLPERITVLFLSANPLDQEQLRLDEEVRAISEMIRKSEHRDSVRLESRWAMRPLDLLQAINECRPRIVHFSGHGSDQDEIVFQNDAGQAKLVSKEAIAQTMAAASADIQLVFFNTCYSRGQAEAVVRHVQAAIGMNTTIGDDAARVFAAQFYSAIGFGLSVDKAFEQARAALMLEGIPEETAPELFAATGIDVRDLVLVRPGTPVYKSTD